MQLLGSSAGWPVSPVLDVARVSRGPAGYRGDSPAAVAAIRHHPPGRVSERGQRVLQIVLITVESVSRQRSHRLLAGRWTPRPVIGRNIERSRRDRTRRRRENLGQPALIARCLPSAANARRGRKRVIAIGHGGSDASAVALARHAVQPVVTQGGASVVLNGLLTT